MSYADINRNYRQLSSAAHNVVSYLHQRRLLIRLNETSIRKIGLIRVKVAEGLISPERARLQISRLHGLYKWSRRGLRSGKITILED